METTASQKSFDLERIMCIYIFRAPAELDWKDTENLALRGAEE